MTLLDSILEDGQATEQTLQRLIGIFGPLGGEIMHDVVSAIQDVKAAVAAPAAAPIAAPEQPAAPEAPAAG